MTATGIGTALLRGFRGRCPHCGRGKLFRAFLKAQNCCAVCDEGFDHHRADDMPAYLVLLLAGHTLIPLVVAVEMHFSPPFWLHAALWLPASLLMCVGLLQPIKGAVIAMQWQMGLHGFAEAKARRIGENKLK